MKNDIVIMNPPYSLKYSGADAYKKDIRFEGYPLAPKSKADYMFVLDGLASLADDGIMVVLLPHGVLFRGGTELEIRKRLVNDGNLRAVIGLPENLFTYTAIPTVILVLQKTKGPESVLFIDASKEFTKSKSINILEKEHVDKITTAYRNSWAIDKFSRVVPLSEIQDNGYNLNIPRYIDTSEKEDPIDLEQVLEDIVQLDIEIGKSLQGFYELFKKLVGNDEEARARLKAQDQIIQKLILQNQKDIEANALDMAAVKMAKEKQKEPHIEEDGFPSDSYQQMTIGMLERIEERKDHTNKTLEIMQDLKKDFLDGMFV